MSLCRDRVEETSFNAENQIFLVGIIAAWWNEIHEMNVRIDGYNLFKRNSPEKRHGRLGLNVKEVSICTEDQEFEYEDLVKQATEEN